MSDLSARAAEWEDISVRPGCTQPFRIPFHVFDHVREQLIVDRDRAASAGIGLGLADGDDSLDQVEPVPLQRANLFVAETSMLSEHRYQMDSLRPLCSLGARYVKVISVCTAHPFLYKFLSRINS